jgi:LysM repeat protein
LVAQLQDLEILGRSAILRPMSAVEGLPAPLPSAEPVGSQPRPDAPLSLCPYLATLDGTWRSATAVRDHRCMAVSPPVQLALEKQRRLCLVDDHVNCATYGAAQAAQVAQVGPSERHVVHSRPIARMTPVILDQGRFDLRVPQLRTDRVSGQAVLVAMLAVAVAAILLARPPGDAGFGALGADRSPTAGTSAGVPTDAAAASASAEPAETEAPAETASPTESAAPPSASSAPSSTAPPSGASAQPTTSGATYKVKSGDTLSAIAARFGTTTRTLIRLNSITDPSKLKIGQVLKLP